MFDRKKVYFRLCHKLHGEVHLSIIVVQTAGLRYDVQEKLIDYLCETNHHSYLDAPKVKIIKNRKKRIQQLYELNISPVTIEARSKIDVLPSIQALLLLP